jgi:hypothetical protein
VIDRKSRLSRVSVHPGTIPSKNPARNGFEPDGLARA